MSRTAKQPASNGTILPPEPALKELFDSSTSAGHYATKYLVKMTTILRSLDLTAVSRLIELVERTCEKGGRIFLIGNGGSAAVASHLMVDLAANTLKEGHLPYRVVSLSDNVESITAIANDFGYENVFAFQLRSQLQAGDLVIAFSVSGNSENVIRAVRQARSMGGTTVGLTGFDGGRLRRRCDVSIHIPSTADEYGPVEDAFSCVGHMVTSFLTMKRGRNLFH